MHDLTTTALAFMDGLWHEELGLLWCPDAHEYSHHMPSGRAHMIRETSWYALALLMRNAPGDHERAERAIAAVLSYQFDEPGAVFHGTFLRAPEEAHPPAQPREWYDYDPNWREFICCTFALMLRHYEPRLSPELVRDMDVAMQRSVAGTLARNVPAAYTNIALMCAFLLDFAAARFGERAWAEQAEQLAQQIQTLFRATGAFEEYNSPTYYGVDLYALALWREHATSTLLREAGAAMEADLWRDIARYYHAGLRNMCGPFDRAYGVDLQRYANLIGMWIWLAVGRERAPFPEPQQPFDHAHDLCYGPSFALLGAQVPAEALLHLQTFTGERLVEQLITAQPRRVATAWLSEQVMLGGEDSGARKPVSYQFHPATMHWRNGNAVAWLTLVHSTPLDARVTPGTLQISCPPQASERQFTFRLCAQGFDAAAISAELWQLPGLSLAVETTLGTPEIVQTGDISELRFVLPAHNSETVQILLRVT